MRGNEILVNGASGNGRYQPMYNGTGATVKPGTIVQKDVSVALKGGRHTFKLYDRNADGDRPLGALWVVLNTMHAMVGYPVTTGVPAGELCQCYSPLAGDELNLMISDANTGTSTNDVAKGTLLIVHDAFGTLIATTGSPQNEVALLLEDVNDLVGDTLGWCEWTGR